MYDKEPFVSIKKWNRSLTNEDFAEAYLTVIATHLRHTMHSLRSNHVTRSFMVDNLPYLFNRSIKEIKLFDSINIEVDENAMKNKKQSNYLSIEEPVYLYLSYRPVNYPMEFGHKFEMKYNLDRRELCIDRIGNE